MMILEVIMISLAVALCIQSAWTDFHTGQVLNKHLICYIVIGTIANAIYYGFFCQDVLLRTMLNFLVIAAISIGFYALHVWSAGDSKLLLTIVYLLPGRIFWTHSDTIVPSVYIFMAVFVLGYLYLIAEAIYFDIRDHKIQKPLVTKDGTLQTAASFIRNFAFLYAWNVLLQTAFPEFVEQNAMLVSLISYFLITIIREYRFYNTTWFLWLCIVLDSVLVILKKQVPGLGSILYVIRSYALVLIVMLATWIASKYSYESIPTAEVKPGMVLSKSTVILFGPSRVQGLPQNSFEDLRSRLTESEAAAVCRWASSKYGKASVVIVRKIPFATFIALGTGIMILYNVANYFSV